MMILASLSLIGLSLVGTFSLVMYDEARTGLVRVGLPCLAAFCTILWFVN